MNKRAFFLHRDLKEKEKEKLRTVRDNINRDETKNVISCLHRTVDVLSAALARFSAIRMRERCGVSRVVMVWKRHDSDKFLIFNTERSCQRS